MAFTQIELLVVISIIAILAVLSLYGIDKMLYQFKKSKSINNLRQMSMALMSYVNDNAGRLSEGAFRPTLNGTKTRYWFSALDYYMGGTDYTVTGGKRGERPPWQNDPLKIFQAPVWDQGFAVNVGYGWNHQNFGYTESWAPQALGWGSVFAQANVPSKTIIIGTSRDTTNGSLEHLLIYPSTNITAAATRYDGAGLYLLLDGHVEAFTPQQISASNNYLFLKTKP